MASIDIAILCMNPTNGNVVWETFESSRAELEKAKREIRTDPDLLNWSERELNRHYALTLKQGAGDGSNLYRPILLALAKLVKPDPDTRSIVGVIAPGPSDDPGVPRLSIFSVNRSVRALMKDNDHEALTGLVRQLERSIPDNAVKPVARKPDILDRMLKQDDAEIAGMARGAKAAAEGPVPSWDELEAMMAEIDAIGDMAEAVKQPHMLPMIQRLLAGFARNKEPLPPAGSHPLLNQHRADIEKARLDAATNGLWDEVERLARLTWDMKDAGIESPAFSEAVERIRQLLRVIKTPPPSPITHPLSRWAVELMEQMDRMGAAGLFDGDGPWRPQGEGRRARGKVTDTIVGFLRWLDKDKSPAARKTLALVAAAEKFCFDGATLVNDLAAHLGLDADAPNLDTFSTLALERFRPDGTLPMPFPVMVITLLVQDDDGIPITLLIALASREGGRVLCEGYMDAAGQGWTVPHRFVIDIAQPTPLLMRDEDRWLESTATVMFDACLTVLLACSLPSQRVPAPGDRHAIAPRVAGRPVMAMRFNTVKLLPPEPRESLPRGPMGERHAPAYHAVRSHDRRLKSGKIVRVKAHHRGDAAGVVDKVYIH